MGKLTDTKIKSFKFEDKPRKYSDDGGLYLLVNATGKYWRYSYRFDKKQKTLAIGVYPSVTLKLARKAHMNARELLEKEVNAFSIKGITP